MPSRRRDPTIGLDVASRTELRRVDVRPLVRPHGLAFAAGKLYEEASRIYTSNIGGNSIAVFERAGNGQNWSETVVPVGRTAYAAVTGDDVVVAIDLETLAITGRIETGGGPDGMAWVPRRESPQNPGAAAQLTSGFRPGA
jgi:hypothetical protein